MVLSRRPQLAQWNPQGPRSDGHQSWMFTASQQAGTVTPFQQMGSWVRKGWVTRPESHSSQGAEMETGLSNI